MTFVGIIIGSLILGVYVENGLFAIAKVIQEKP